MDIPAQIQTPAYDIASRTIQTPQSSFVDMPASQDTTLSDSTLNQGSQYEVTGREPNLHSDGESLPQSVMGQFSYAPATQTTVVTTTTTTTTSFPPLRMKAPSLLHQIDSKMYPLAACPTPQSIKKLSFHAAGRHTMFCEADDSQEALHRYKQQQSHLQHANGMIKTVATSSSSAKPPRSCGAETLNRTLSIKGHRPKTSTYLGNRSISPAALENAKITQGSCNNNMLPGTPPTSTNKDVSTEPCRQSRASSRLQISQISTPITPSLEPGHVISSPDVSRYRRSVTRSPRMNRQSIASPQASRIRTTQTLSPQPEFTNDFNYNEREEADDPMLPSACGLEAAFDPSIPEMTDLRHLDSQNELMEPPARPRPSALDMTSAQDISLPSPSLSPVTAAANQQHRRGYFEDMQTSAGVASGGSLILENDPDDVQTWSFDDDTLDHDPSTEQRAMPSMMEIPVMLDSFEALPAEMKNYVMYQLLRRCPKPVLHFVADVVDPALKCDFLSLLPPELCQSIIGSLDARTLCRAAQVSRKWRHVINSDEKTWKELLDKDGFVLPPGELQRAVLEGWGWQNASGPEDWEQNISGANVASNAERLSDHFMDFDIPSMGVPTTPDNQSTIAHNKRPKRKPATRSKPTSRKVARRKEAGESAEAQFDVESLIRHVSDTSDGPYAAATAAAVAVPCPSIGLPGLRDLHLYKSIYQRHCIIRNNWMQDRIQPQHIAFKAHQRHVVTCLQFDSDKIITGSDDTSINVYDTKTGALRAKLEGHDGGVWALQYEGSVLVSGSTDRSVRVWDIESGKCTQVFQGHTSTVRCLQILMPTVCGTTSDGRDLVMPKQPLIVTGSRDSTLRVWRLPQSGSSYGLQANQSVEESESHYFVRALNGHHHSVRAIAAHADTLVSGSYDFTVRVWKISTGETVHRLQGHTQKVYSVVLDTKRNRCISGSMDNVIKVWSLDTGSVMFNLEGHSSLVGLLDLQQDRLVSAAADSTLRIWDPENGLCKSTLSKHTGAITCFQHDGQKVISGSDRTLKMWNVQNGALVKDLLTDLSGVWQVKFDERRCVAAVQRNGLTYIEVLDFGASRDGVAAGQRGVRMVVDVNGDEITEQNDPRENTIDLEAIADE